MRAFAGIGGTTEGWRSAIVSSSNAALASINPCFIWRPCSSGVRSGIPSKLHGRKGFGEVAPAKPQSSWRKHVLGGLRYALGLEKADATPSAKAKE